MIKIDNTIINPEYVETIFSRRSLVNDNWIIHVLFRSGEWIDLGPQLATKAACNKAIETIFKELNV